MGTAEEDHGVYMVGVVEERQIVHGSDTVDIDVGAMRLCDANPLSDIKNIRKVRTVMAGGKVVPHATLPEKRVLSVAKH